MNETIRPKRLRKRYLEVQNQTREREQTKVQREKEKRYLSRINELVLATVKRILNQAAGEQESHQEDELCTVIFEMVHELPNLVSQWLSSCMTVKELKQSLMYFNRAHTDELISYLEKYGYDSAIRMWFYNRASVVRSLQVTESVYDYGVWPSFDLMDYCFDPEQVEAVADGSVMHRWRLKKQDPVLPISRFRSPSPWKCLLYLCKCNDHR